MNTSLATAAVLFVLSALTGCASTGSLGQAADTFAATPSGGHDAVQTERPAAETVKHSFNQARASVPARTTSARTERVSRPNPERHTSRPSRDHHVSRPADRSRFSSSR